MSQNNILKWIQSEVQKRRQHPGMNWKKTLDNDLGVLDLTWSETTELTENCKEWYSRIARFQFCIIFTTVFF